MADSINLGIRITADGKGAEATINNLNKTIEKVGDSSRKATSSLGGIEKATQGLGNAATTAGRALASIGVAISVRELSRIADTYTNLSSRLKLVSGNQSEFARSMQDVSSIANKYQVELSAVGQAYSKIAPVVAGMGKSQRDMTAVISSLSAAMKVSGTEAGRMSEVLRQFSQAVSGPTVQMEEMNTIIDDASALWQGLQRQFPGLIQQYGSLKEAIAKGAISSQDLINATIQLRAEFEAQAASMQTTVSGAMQVLNNEFTKYIGQADQSTGASAEFASTLLLISNNLNEILDPLATVVSTVAKVEIGGWLTLVETLKEAKVQLKEMAGLKDAGGAIDPEVAKLMRYGSGQASIAEIAGPPPQAQEAQKQYFDGIKKGAAESVFAMTKLSEKQREVAQIVLDTAKAQKVDPAFALAIAEQESGFNQLAKSAAGARGVMQLMPGTAKDLGVNFADLNDNIKGGVLYLSQQEKQFKSMRLAAAAYNAGPGNVQKFGGVPPFKETQNYVVSVGALYEKWKKVLGVQGEAFVSAKDQAEELSNAFKSLETHHDAMLNAATLAAKEAEASRATQLQQIELERKTAEEAAKQAISTATTQQQKIAAVDQLRVAEESAAQRSKALIDERITTEQGLLEIKRAALADELANADRYNLTIVEQARLKQELLGIESQLRMVADTRAQAELQAASEQLQIDSQLRDMAKDRHDAQRQAEQAVADEQLRLNAAFANGVQQAQLFAQQASAAFGTVGESIGKMVVGVAQFAEQLYQIERDRDNAIAKLNKSAMQGDISPEKQAEEIAKEQMKWADKSAQYQISMMGDISDATKGFFKEGSKGYKAMEMATKAFRMFEMAMAIKSMVTQIMGTEAVAAAGVKATGQAVIQSQVTGASAAPAAVAKAGEQSGWPGAIAMAAFMAAIGFGVMGAMGGSSRTVKAEDRQKTQGTGTVFGDAAAQSNSIANSLEIIRDNSSNDLNYSAAMLRSLEDLSNSILALANQVTSIVMPSIDAAIQASGMQFGKTNISLFSGFNKQLTDSGIGWFEASLSRILQGDFTAKMYADITRSFEVMGMALSESTKTYVRDAGSEVSNQIILIFKDMVSALQEGASAFGKSSEQVMNALKGFKVGMEQISLKDMSMEEQTQALNAVFSKINDQMAARLNRVLDLGLGMFRKAGEGMAETFYRVSNAITTAKGAMEQMGLVAVDYKTLTAAQAQGDVAAEIAKQTVITQMTLADGVKEYITELTGSVDDIVDATKKLIEASNAMRTAGFNEGDLNRTMINAAGGLDAFNEAMTAFNENFLSEADRYAGDVRNLTNQFAAFGYALPDSKEAFAAMVAGIDTSTEAGQKLFGQMIALADSFAKVADQAQQIRDKYASILDPFKAFSDRIKTVGTDFATLLGGVTGNSQGRIDAIIAEANKARVNPQKDKDMMTKAIESNLLTVKNINDEIDGWQAKIDAEMAKKKPNRAKISKWQGNINALRDQLGGLNDAISIYQGWLDEANKRLAEIDVQEGIDKAAESARLAQEKKGIVADAVTAMGATLEQVFADIAATVQAAQQRLQSVIAMQKGLASQLAQLQGPGAVFSLSQSNLAGAWGDINNYIGGVQGGAARNVDTEVSLINAAQQAVMDKYNAEIAAIQESEREFIAAETERLNAALQAQIEAINAATDAAIQAENDRLDAAVKAQGKLDDAAQKAMQKQFDAEQKALQKAHDAQLQNLQDELDAANKLKDAIKSIADYARGMALGGNSPLSPEQRLAEAQRQYQELLARAQGGDAEAMSRLTGASDAYLEASKQYYGSGTQYANTFDAVKNAMSAIGGMSAPDPDSIQSRIDLLREQQTEEMDALRELQSDQLDLLREQQQERIDQMRKASQDVQDGIRKAAQSQIEELQKQTQQAIADLSDPNKNAAMKAARESAEAELKKLQELAELTRIEAQKQADEAKEKAEQMAKDALDLANAQLAKLDENAKINAAQLGALNSILINSGLQPIPGYAKGGMTGTGLAIVGEQGPELVRFNRPGQVYNANDTKSMLGDDEKIVAAITELKAEMRAVVVTQSNANPQIIEKLAGMEARLSKMERTQRFTVGA